MKEQLNPLDPTQLVIRICPACGVVNPAGPSTSCLHLQLARFDGVPEELLLLLDEVAQARGLFEELSSHLRQRVKEAIRNQQADVETPRDIRRMSDIENLRSRPRPPGGFALETPRAPDAQKPRRDLLRQRKKTVPSRPVDSRQLELLLHAPPKGHA